MKYNETYLKELRLIVKFMGGSFFEIVSETTIEKNLYGKQYWKCNLTPKNKRSWITPSGLFYKKKWEWLMPVVLKICSDKKFKYRIKYIKHVDLWVATLYHNSKEFCDEDGSKYPLKSTYKVIILFLKWLENIV